MSKKIDELEKDKEYFKSLTSNAITTAKKSISALNFVTQNFTKELLLEAFDDYSEIKDYCETYGVGKGSIILHKDEKLLRYLGDLLIKCYEKEDPHKQSVWNSDVPRRNYLI